MPTHHGVVGLVTYPGCSIDLEEESAFSSAQSYQSQGHAGPTGFYVASDLGPRLVISTDSQTVRLAGFHSRPGGEKEKNEERSCTGPVVREDIDGEHFREGP